MLLKLSMLVYMLILYMFYTDSTYQMIMYNLIYEMIFCIFYVLNMLQVIWDNYILVMFNMLKFMLSFFKFKLYYIFFPVTIFWAIIVMVFSFAIMAVIFLILNFKRNFFFWKTLVLLVMYLMLLLFILYSSNMDVFILSYIFFDFISLFLMKSFSNQFCSMHNSIFFFLMTKFGDVLLFFFAYLLKSLTLFSDFVEMDSENFYFSSNKFKTNFHGFDIMEVLGVFVMLFIFVKFIQFSFFFFF